MKTHQFIILITALVGIIVGGILMHSRVRFSQQDQERLFTAIRNDDTEMIAQLAHHLDKFDDFTEFGTTPIHESARYGRVRSLEYLLSNGANVNARDDRLQTPIHIAIRNVTRHQSHGHVTFGGSPRPEQMAIVQLLLDRGADPDATDKDGKTPRDWAVSLNLPMVAAMLDSQRPNE